MNPVRIGDTLTPDLIELQVGAEDWRSAIRSAGELLFRGGICEAGYIEAMIEAVERYGPYMVIAPGIALVHSRPEDGALTTGLSLITLSNPVDFAPDGTSPVSLVIALSAATNDWHVEILKQLAEALMDRENRDVLISATSKVQVMELFSLGKRAGKVCEFA